MPSIYDKGDMQFADEAFDILGFSTQMKYDVFKNTTCMMHMGNMTKDFVPIGKVAELLGIDCEWMITYCCKPKLKVGTEWVQKGKPMEAPNTLTRTGRRARVARLRPPTSKASWTT